MREDIFSSVLRNIDVFELHVNKYRLIILWKPSVWLVFWWDKGTSNAIFVPSEHTWVGSLHANIQDTLGFLSAVKTYILEV